MLYWVSRTYSSIVALALSALAFMFITMGSKAMLPFCLSMIPFFVLCLMDWVFRRKEGGYDTLFAKVWCGLFLLVYGHQVWRDVTWWLEDETTLHPEGLVLVFMILGVPALLNGLYALRAGREGVTPT